MNNISVQIRLVVTSATKRLESIYILHLSLDGVDLNANPQIAGVQVLGDVVRDQSVWLHAEVGSEQSEIVAGKREQLLLTWFVESGKTDLERTSYIDGVQSLDHATQVVWTPATRADYPRDTSRIIVVLRDDRGGVSWNDTLTVTLP